MSWIGRAIRRREDPKFLRGEGSFVDDLTLPKMAYAVFVRSPVAHGVLRAVHLDAARGAPGVITAVTAADFAGRLQPVIPFTPEGAQIARAPHSLLASGKVRYVGEPVAGVLAETREAAEDAAALITMDIDPLPAVTTTAQALAAAVLLHDAAPGNVLLRWARTHGDVEKAFAAARAVSQHFHIPRLAAGPIEARGAVAVYDPGADLLTVWCSMQDPHRPRAQLSRILQRPDDRVRVIIPDVGGAFGSKGHVPPETAITAALAIEWRRPVKWAEDRRENLAATYQGRGLDVDASLAVDAAGRVQGMRVRIVADLGAYLYPATAQVPLTASSLLTGSYAIPVIAVETVGVATNKVPTGPYRGAGRPEAAYVIERMMDLTALELDMDPVALRRINLIRGDQLPYRTPLGLTYDSGDYAQTLDRACELIGYDARRRPRGAEKTGGRLSGVGVTPYVERAGAQLWESAAISVGPSGRVIVRMGSTPTGQAHETTFGQIAADVLQIDPEAVSVEHGDSAVVPRGVGTFGSRSTTVGGSALYVAAERVKAKASRIAAHLLEAAAEDMVWAGGRITVAGAPERGVTLAEVAAAAFNPGRLPPGIEMGLDAQVTYRLPGPVFPYGAYGAAVEVDPETGQVAIIDLVCVDDVGRVVNPLTAEGQVIGGTVQGLGQAFTEEVVYDPDGQLLTATYADYGMPRAEDVPVVRSEFMETPSPLNPLGVKGIGEAGSIAAPAAVASAVHDAVRPLGIRHIDFPLTPRRIWQAIHSR